MNQNFQLFGKKVWRPIIGLFFMAGSLSSNAQCTTPPDQTFGTYEDVAYEASVQYECITYTGYSPGGVYVGIGDTGEQGISLSPLFSGSAVVIGNNSLGGGYAEMRSANGNEFALKSMVAEFYGHENGNCTEVYDIVGYRNDIEVVRISNFNVTASTVMGSGSNTLTWVRNSYDNENNNSGVLSFGAAWSNIDAIRFNVVESDPYHSFFVGIDNIDFEAATALPVTFGTVTAFLYNDHIDVRWTTLTETNNSRFEIQLSQDGKAFTPVKTVTTLAPEGSISTALDYHVVINRPATGVMISIGLLLPLISIIRKRNSNILICVFLLIALLLFNGCKKQQETMADGEKDIFLRIAQIDKDGTVAYSKTLKVVNKN